MSLTEAKRCLVQKKEGWGLEGTIEKADTYEWEQSFSRQ
jgi:hypothetical protein